MAFYNEQIDNSCQKRINKGNLLTGFEKDLKVMVLRMVVTVLTSSLGTMSGFYLIPKLIASNMTEAGAASSAEANAARSWAIETLSHHTWVVPAVVKVAVMFHEIRLSSDELKSVIVQLLHTLRRLPEDELPPLVYQLLLLSSTSTNKQLTLRGIVDHFRFESIIAHSI